MTDRIFGFINIIIMALLFCNCGLFTPEDADPPLVEFVDIFNFEDILDISNSGRIVDFAFYKDLFVTNDSLYKNYSDKYYASYEIVNRLEEVNSSISTGNKFNVRWSKDVGVTDPSFDGKSTVTLGKRKYEILIEDSLVFDGVSVFTIAKDDVNTWKIKSWIDSSSTDPSFFNPGYAE